MSPLVPCIAALWLLTAVLGGEACAADLAPPEPARDVDLARYAGRWYVIARQPSGDDVGSYFEFRRRADGRFDDVYVARDDGFAKPPETVQRIARPDPQRPALWEVRGGWLSSEERMVLYVSADYRHALVGDADRSSVWILAREPEIPEWTYAGLLARLAMQGYDVSRFRKVPQRPEQIGRAGFE